MNIGDLLYRYFFEVPNWQTQWQGISLVEVARKKELSINQLAASDLYATFYETLEATNFSFETSWLKQKKKWSRHISKYIESEKEKKPSARFLSIGAGTGIIEEDLIKQGIQIDLQECQSSSLNYLRSRGISFKEYIGTDLSMIPDASYNMIFVLGVVYTMSYSDYIKFLESIYRILDREGKVVLLTVRVSWKKIPLIQLYKWPWTLIKKGLKKIIGKSCDKGVFWGWHRHSILHERLAKRAGFTIIESYNFENSIRGYTYQK